MSRAEPISDYLTALAGELAFDPRLARRVCDEVADHLWEAADAAPSNTPQEAQKRAIASFGSPRDVATQYLPLSLFELARRVGASVILAIAGVLIGMRLCSAWYEITQGAVPGDLQNLDAIGVFVDRGASLVALVSGIVGWAYIAGQDVPSNLRTQTSRRLGQSFLIFTLTTGALLLSVISDAVVIGLRILASTTPVTSSVPILVVGVEVALTAILCRKLFSMTRLMAVARVPLGR